VAGKQSLYGKEKTMLVAANLNIEERMVGTSLDVDFRKTRPCQGLIPN